MIEGDLLARWIRACVVYHRVDLMVEVGAHMSHRRIRHLAATWLRMGVEPLKVLDEHLWSISSTYALLLSKWADGWTEAETEAARTARTNFAAITDGDERIETFQCCQMLYSALLGAAHLEVARLGLAAMAAETLHAMASRDLHGVSDRAATDSWRRRSGEVLINLLGRGWEFSPEWRTSTAVALAGQIYKNAEWDACPVLADALQDAGMPEDHKALAYLRGDETKFRGTWVLDRILDKH